MAEPGRDRALSGLTAQDAARRLAADGPNEHCRVPSAEERFDVYVGQRFEEVSSGEAEFLHRHLIQNFPAKGLANS